MESFDRKCHCVFVCRSATNPRNNKNATKSLAFQKVGWGLEEAACSDIILKIADASDSEAAEQLSVTDEVLNDLGCGDIPQVTVYNKCDRTGVAPYDPDVLLVSAKTGYGLDSLLAKIDEILAHRVRTIEVLLPYDKLALADVFRTRGSVLAEEYRENGVYYKATVKVDDLHRFEAYLL